LYEFAEVVLASSGGGGGWQQWLHLLHSGYATAVVGQLLVTLCIMQFGCAAAAASAVIFESQQLSLTLHIGAKMLLATCGKLLRRHEPTRAIYDTLDAPIWWAKKARPQTFVHNCVKS